MGAAYLAGTHTVGFGIPQLQEAITSALVTTPLLHEGDLHNVVTHHFEVLPDLPFRGTVREDNSSKSILYTVWQSIYSLL